MTQQPADDGALAQWFVEVDRRLAAGGIRTESRSRLLWNVVRRLAQGSGPTAGALLDAGPAEFAGQVLRERDRCATQVPVGRAVVAGALGAAAGAVVAWFGVFRFFTAEWVPSSLLTHLGVALALDLTAVAIVLVCSLLAVLIATGDRLPGLAGRLAVLSAVAALTAWPLITAVAAVHHFSWQPRILATEMLIGLALLMASIWLARRWALTARIENLRWS